MRGHMVTGMGTGMDMDMDMDTGMGIIRMMRRLCVGRVGGRGCLGRRREDGTRDAGHGTENSGHGTRDAGQVDLRFTILDLRLKDC